MFDFVFLLFFVSSKQPNGVSVTFIGLPCILLIPASFIKIIFCLDFLACLYATKFL